MLFQRSIRHGRPHSGFSLLAGLLLAWLGLEPLLDMHMRLGEGTGAAIGITLAEAACKVLAEMATFAEAGVSDKE